MEARKKRRAEEAKRQAANAALQVRDGCGHVAPHVADAGTWGEGPRASVCRPAWLVGARRPQERYEQQRQEAQAAQREEDEAAAAGDGTDEPDEAAQEHEDDAEPQVS